VRRTAGETVLDIVIRALTAAMLAAMVWAIVEGCGC
jgi:hypothetical protein